MTKERQRPGAEEQFAKHLEHLDKIVARVHGWIHDEPVPRDDTFLGNVKMAMVIRALNQFRAILVLLRTNHWEEGLLATRALFELALNAEELMLRSDDREVAAQRFLKFAHLQAFLEWLALERYQVTSGRADSARAAELNQVEKSARKVFHEFAFRDKKGRDRWRTSWTNKTVAHLCTLSRNKLRRAQYQTIYVKASAFTHSSPAGITSSMSPSLDEFEAFVAHADAVEARGFKLVASFAILFLLDCMLLVGDRLPAYRPMQLLEDATAALKSLGYAVPAPS